MDMTNNKQQTAVQWFLDQLIEHRIIIVDKTTYQVKYKHEILLEQAKEMEAIGKKMSYAEGYKEGYKRALDYMTNTLKNTIQIKENGSNNSTTVNTTGTTVLCTEFVSDQLFYKGTLPHCMRCGKPQYQHPIISNTI
jgi:phosphoenolpyruvate carboxylase